MPTINFPSSPTLNQEYSYNGKVWRWNGTGWALTLGKPYGREILTANRTYYVATTGSDSADGLTVGSPFLTIQKAVDVVSATLDMGNYLVTIRVGDGTRTEAITLKAYIGGIAPNIIGNITTPASCLLNTTGNCFSLGVAVPWIVKGFKLTGTNAGFAVSGGGKITHYNMDFGTFSGLYSAHIFVYPGSAVLAGGAHTISGGAFAHVWPTHGGYFQSNWHTVTLTGTPNFTGAFLYSRGGVGTFDGMTYSGSATGVKYTLSVGANFFAGTTVLPGSVGGSSVSNSYWGA